MANRTITPQEPADFTPDRQPYTDLKPFRFWCQKVLPLVYDDSLSYYELLCKIVDYLNKTMEDVNNFNTDMDNLYTAYSELQDYVNNYFSTLDVQEEINNKLDTMAEDGTLSNLIQPLISNILPPLVVDSTTEMTNINRTYILKSNQHVYQYNTTSSSWVDTGIVYGETIGNVYTNYIQIAENVDLNDLTTFGAYYCENEISGILNKPFDTDFILLCYTFGNVTTQIAYDRASTTMKIRQKYSTSWGDWLIPYLTAGNSIPNNSDFNGLNDNTMYSFLEQYTYTNAPAFDSGIVFSVVIGSIKTQIAFQFNGNKVALRSYYTSWGDWQEVYPDLTQYISTDTATLPINTDLNNLDNNMIFFMVEGRTYLNAPPFAAGNILTTLVGSIKMQIAFEFNGNAIAMRSYYQNWTAWYLVNKPQYYTMSVLGDSISDYDGYNNYDNTHDAYYPALGVTSFPLMWHSRVSQRLNNNLSYINAYGGTTITKLASGNRSFVDRVKDVPCTDLIIVEGGTNDKLTNAPIGNYVYENWTETDLQTFRGALAYILDYLTTRNYNSKIVFFQSNYIDGDYSESIATICEHYNIQVVMFGWEYTDTVHPTNSQMLIMANNLVNSI